MASIKQLQDIANILRRDVLKMTTIAGSGHPTSCSSCAEIISALFFHQMNYDIKNPENPDNDEFILSKGHAAPILYAALYRAGAINDDLSALRKLESSLEGHPIPNSLKWIKVATGSLGQGLSVGLGMSLAAKLQKRNFFTYVLLGDSETSEGSIYEALQLGSYYNLNNLIAIVDINRLGQRGETMLGHDVNTYKERFNSFGWSTLAIDGHNMAQILNALKKAKSSKKPTIILAKTLKGRDFQGIENKNNWHGKAIPMDMLEKILKKIPNPEMPKITITKPAAVNYIPKRSKLNLNEYKLNDQIATRTAYGKTLAALAAADSSIIAIDAEVSNSTHSDEVKQKTPKQFIEAFIAEQNMISMALGLSKKGFNVFASTFSAFLSRAHDQIRMSALSSPNFTVSGSHAGISIGEDGASQMGLEDIALFRALPNSIIFYPSDAVSTGKLTCLASKTHGLKYIRTTRGKTPVIYTNSHNFALGDFSIVRQSKDDQLTLIGAGISLHESLKAHDLLKSNYINSAVIDLYCIKPLDAKKLISFIRNHGNKAIITEDHYKEGGIGEMLSQDFKNADIKVKHLCIDNQIPHSGKSEQLLEKYKLSARNIELAAKKF